MKTRKKTPIIPKPDVSVAQVILAILSPEGAASFKEIRDNSESRSATPDRSENSFYTAIARLKRRRLLRRTAYHKYELTPSGEFHATKARVRRALVVYEKNKADKKQWDGKWRIVIFAIPEQRRYLRDYLRTLLQRMGFSELQRSFWIFPHRIPAFLSDLLNDNTFHGMVRAITTLGISYDQDLQKKYKLS